MAQRQLAAAARVTAGAEEVSRVAAEAMVMAEAEEVRRSEEAAMATAARTGARHNRYNRFRVGRAHTQILGRHHRNRRPLYSGSYWRNSPSQLEVTAEHRMVVAALDAVAAERLAAGEVVRRRGSSSHKWSSRHTSLSHRHTSVASCLLPLRHWPGQKIRSIVSCRLQSSHSTVQC